MRDAAVSPSLLRLPSLTNLSVASRAGPRQSLKVALPSVHVMGIPSVSRAVINEEASGDLDQKGGKTYYLLVEGYGLQDVMGRLRARATPLPNHRISSRLTHCLTCFTRNLL